MKKLLVICGPTATGKTKLALRLAKKFRGELVSADSRQVYKYMNIGTGKDLPLDAKYKILDTKLGGFYEVGGVRIWGYDLVHPTEEFSVGQYLKIVTKILENIDKRKNLPILVGGTGLYIKGVVDGIPTASIPKNKILRDSLKEEGLTGLYNRLAQLDPVRAAQLNVSDKRNPARLIRAIEIAEYRVKMKDKSVLKPRKYDVLFIGLYAPKKYLDKKIKKRVNSRIKLGLKKEIQGLFEKGATYKHQSMGTLGYKEWEGYFEGKKTYDMVKTDWETGEKKYIKRQMTWFKRDRRVSWFDISKAGWRKEVEIKVEEWYSSNRKNLP